MPAYVTNPETATVENANRYPVPIPEHTKLFRGNLSARQ
jgi:hypothetical protein